MKVIVTGATGMVGEGVLLAALADARVTEVLAVARRSCGHAHPKLREIVVKDFRDVSAIEGELRGWDACFYCAGISSIGMDEAAYTAVTYDTPLAFCTTLARLNPQMTLCHVSGRSTDSSEQGKVMWARVKGKAENALSKLPFARVVHFRPALMKPVKGQKHLPRGGALIPVLYPVFRALAPKSSLTLEDVERAMVNAVVKGAPKSVLEVVDIQALADA